jgi:hypothetical protein
MMNYDLSGAWHSSYKYTSSAKDGAFTSDYDVKLHKIGNHLVVESLPNQEGSYLIMRLTLDNRIATGVWEESTSPTGSYKGVVYHGAVQLVLDENENTWRGRYVGFSRNMEVLGNEWVISKK